jgi:hypothetical protein
VFILKLRVGCDKDRGRPDSVTPLSIATVNGLTAGCHMEKANDAGYTPLFMAACISTIIFLEH